MRPRQWPASDAATGDNPPERDDVTGRGDPARTGGGRVWLVPSLWAVAVIMAAVGLSLSVAAGAPLGAHADSPMLVVVATVGALLAVRVRSNPIGWILLGVGVLGGLVALANGAADVVLLGGSGPRDLGLALVWVSNWLFWPVITVPLTFVLLLFPDGRLPSRRWRPLLWLAAVGIASTAAFIAFNPDKEGWAPFDIEENPFAMGPDSPFMVALQMGAVLQIPVLVAAVALLVVRFRRATGVELQQIKWVVYAGVIAVPVWLVTGTVFDETIVGKAGFAFASTVVPVAIALAVLRYRLYEIDRLISRTIVYGLTMAGLVAVYAAVVIGVPRVLPVALDSPVAVATATLAVAGLFRPVTRRVQQMVDRRFYRRRYDAELTVEHFADRLSHEVDLELLRGELCALVADTMHPDHVGLWLREAVRSR